MKLRTILDSIGRTIVGMDQLLRLTCNPFFPYLERRLREWIEAGVSGRSRSPAPSPGTS